MGFFCPTGWREILATAVRRDSGRWGSGIAERGFLCLELLRKAGSRAPSWVTR